MTTKEFIKKLDGSDADLLKKMEGCKSDTEAYEVAKSAGVTDSAEVFKAAMSELKNAVGELSEDDLENVAGGASSSEIASAVTASVGAAATAASAAATCF